MVTMTANFPTIPVNWETPRRERLENLKQYFLRILSEDPQDGTPFDCDVLTMIKHLEEIYYDNNEIRPSSVFGSATQIAKNQRIDEIMETSREKPITEEDYNELRELLKEKYCYGDLMGDYCCPKCDHPLLFSWANGAICLWSNGGCGWKLGVE